MNTAAKKLILVYSGIKRSEWGSTAHNPPEGLDKLGNHTDDVFILYQLRRYLRLKTYPRLWTNLKGVWQQEHFDLLWKLIDLCWPRIVLNPLLNAYVNVYKLILKPYNDATQPDKIEELLQFLRVNRDQIPGEDWVDILSALSSYCTTAENNGQRHYIHLAFTTRLLIIEHKYGESWDISQTPYLPYVLFFNTIKQGLEAQDKFIWNKLELDFIPATERYRGVHDWLRLFSKHYRTRLDPSIEPVVVNYTEALICFDEKDFQSSHTALVKATSKTNEIINISVRILRLQVLYMLATYPLEISGSNIRQFIGESERELKNLNRALDYLELEKEKYPPKRVAAFRGWARGYTMLRSVYSTIVTKGNAPSLQARQQLISGKRTKLPESYHNLNHPRKDWLEAALDRLERTGKG